jgi:hypothetical protein
MTATATTPAVHGWLARAVSDVAVITRRNLFTVRLLLVVGRGVQHRRQPARHRVDLAEGLGGQGLR